MQNITNQQIEYIEKKTKEIIKEADENREPNSWLKQVGWVQHLKDSNLEQLRAAIELPNASKEPKLQAIIDIFHRVVDTA